VRSMGRLVCLLVVAMGCESRLVLVDPADAGGSPGGCPSACPSGQECIDGGCVQPKHCGPDNCDACCLDTDCIPKNFQTFIACGLGGEPCKRCPSDNPCNNGVCEMCGPTTCAGCCDFFATCVLMDSDLQCGAGGTSCKLCSGGTHCFGGVCQ